MKEIYKDKERNKLIIVEELPTDGMEVRGGFREKMLLNNRIDGLLEFRVNVVDHEKRLEYDTEGMETLDSLCERSSLNDHRIRNILKGIVTVCLAGEKYMLDVMDYIMDPRYIYIRRDDTPVIAYYSGYARPFRSQIENLAEYLMNRTDYHNKEGVLTIYTVYMKSREEGFGVRELKAFLEKGITEEDSENEADDGYISGSGHTMYERYTADERYAADEVYMADEGYMAGDEHIRGGKYTADEKYVPDVRRVAGKALLAAAFVLIVFAAFKLKLTVTKDGKQDIIKILAVILAAAGAFVYIYKKFIPAKDNIKKKTAAKGKRETKEKRETRGKRTDDKEEEATELLFDPDVGRGQAGSLSLFSDSYPRIDIDRFPFYIGKDQAHMDFCLDESGVSRYHLKVDLSEGKICIFDLNSTNGSFLNGKKLTPDRPFPVRKGDEVRIARCCYRVG